MREAPAEERANRALDNSGYGNPPVGSGAAGRRRDRGRSRDLRHPRSGRHAKPLGDPPAAQPERGGRCLADSAAAGAPGPLGEPEERDGVALAAPGPQQMRAAWQRGVECPGLSARPQHLRRRAVLDDRRHGEESRCACHVAGPEGVGPPADDADVTCASRERRCPGGRRRPVVGATLRPVRAAAAGQQRGGGERQQDSALHRGERYPAVRLGREWPRRPPGSASRRRPGRTWPRSCRARPERREGSRPRRRG